MILHKNSKTRYGPRALKILIREFLNENEPTTNVNNSLEKVEHILIANAKIKFVKIHRNAVLKDIN